MLIAWIKFAQTNRSYHLKFKIWSLNYFWKMKYGPSSFYLYKLIDDFLLIKDEQKTDELQDELLKTIYKQILNWVI